MSSPKRKRLVGAIAIVAATAVLAVGGVAIADHQPGHVTLTGGGVLETKIQTGTLPFTTAGEAFAPLSGSEVTFSVPSGTTRLFNARFTAQTDCFGLGMSFGPCTARVVGQNNSTGFVFELNPQSGTNFVFDFAPANDDEREAHAMERSRRVLTAGSYTFFVQLRTLNPNIILEVSNWHFAVDKHS